MLPSFYVSGEEENHPQNCENNVENKQTKLPPRCWRRCSVVGWFMFVKIKYVKVATFFFLILANWKTNKRRRPPRCWRRGPSWWDDSCGRLLANSPLTSQHFTPRAAHPSCPTGSSSIFYWLRQWQRQRQWQKQRQRQILINRQHQKTPQHFKLCQKIQWPSCNPVFSCWDLPFIWGSCSNSACYGKNECPPSCVWFKVLTARNLWRLKALQKPAFRPRASAFK